MSSGTLAYWLVAAAGGAALGAYDARPASRGRKHGLIALGVLFVLAIGLYAELASCLDRRVWSQRVNPLVAWIIELWASNGIIAAGIGYLLGFGAMALKGVPATPVGAAAVPGGAIAPPRQGWTQEQILGLVYQLAVSLLTVLLIAYLVNKLQSHYQTKGIQAGFGFLCLEAGIPIAETLIPYTPASTYARAILVGFLNTLHVSIIGIVLASILGLLLGIMLLSRNWLVARLAGGLVHVLRNVPLLLQIIVWYTLITALPAADKALKPLPGFYLTQRGLDFPAPVWAPGWTAALLALLLAIILSLIVRFWATRRQARTGETFPVGLTALALVVALPVVAWAALGAPSQFDVPQAITRFGRSILTGGRNVSPEFLALLIGLTIYTAVFIAEIVRSGIRAVSKGQIEAAKALGLREGVILRQVTLPQAMRVIIPPLTSQFLNLTKNSSLAAGVGYQDLVSITNTTANQSGFSVEAFSIIMIVFTLTSLATSAFMNWYNTRIRLVER